MTQVAALFVDPSGAYANRSGVTPWTEREDARLYRGPHPVVAHPPCNLWVNMAAVNWRRYGRQRPAWYPGGHDEGCFASALESVRQYGGVLEHPASSHAWARHGLRTPPREGGWSCAAYANREWVCEVWQSAYGHPCRKRTWLYYCGIQEPFELDWTQVPGTHQVGWFDRAKPTVSKRQASATPPDFADTLVRLAVWSRGGTTGAQYFFFRTKKSEDRALTPALRPVYS